MEARLKTHMQVGAAVRAGAVQGITVTVAHKGEPDSGALLLKLNQGPKGCTVLSQMRDLNGELVWMRATGAEPVPESECDAYIEKSLRRDPDLWVVEIEDREGRHLFDGRVL